MDDKAKRIDTFNKVTKHFAEEMGVQDEIMFGCDMESIRKFSDETIIAAMMFFAEEANRRNLANFYHIGPQH